MSRQGFEAADGQPAVPRVVGDISAGAAVKWVVSSLYVDEALPRGPLLQWFLAALLGVKLGHLQLRKYIDEMPGIYVEPPSAKKLNFHVVLEKPPPGFKGFACEEEDVANTLQPEAWQEVASFLVQGGWPKATDAAHKFYVIVSWLQDVSAQMREMSFGRVLSIVRFSAQVKGLLGHRNGLFVPYEQSEECERQTNACTGRPTRVVDGETFVQTWPHLQESLRRLLKMQPNGCMEVSKMKLLFRSVLHTELSETVFGHQSLSKLLADPLLGDEFSLGVCNGNRYVLRLSSDHASTLPSSPDLTTQSKTERPKVALSLADATDPDGSVRRFVI